MDYHALAQMASNSGNGGELSGDAVQRFGELVAEHTRIENRAALDCLRRIISYYDDPRCVEEGKRIADEQLAQEIQARVDKETSELKKQVAVLTKERDQAIYRMQRIETEELPALVNERDTLATELDALIEAAKSATVIDHNEQEGWYSAEIIREQGAHFPKNARFIAACAPTTILELCTLLEKAEDVLADTQKIMNMWPSSSLDIAVTEALAAIKQWKEKT